MEVEGKPLWYVKLKRQSRLCPPFRNDEKDREKRRGLRLYSIPTTCLMHLQRMMDLDPRLNTMKRKNKDCRIRRLLLVSLDRAKRAWGFGGNPHESIRVLAFGVGVAMVVLN